MTCTHCHAPCTLAFCSACFARLPVPLQRDTKHSHNTGPANRVLDTLHRDCVNDAAGYLATTDKAAFVCEVASERYAGWAIEMLQACGDEAAVAEARRRVQERMREAGV